MIGGCLMRERKRERGSESVKRLPARADKQPYKRLRVHNNNDAETGRAVLFDSRISCRLINRIVGLSTGSAHRITLRNVIIIIKKFEI